MCRRAYKFFLPVYFGMTEVILMNDEDEMRLLIEIRSGKISNENICDAIRRDVFRNIGRFAADI
jgi:hypothetical protein